MFLPEITHALVTSRSSDKILFNPKMLGIVEIIPITVENKTT